MPWWAWLWSATLLVLAVVAAWLDARDGEPAWFVGLGLFVGGHCAWFVLAFFAPPADPTVHRLLLPTAVLAGAGLAYECARDWLDMTRERESRVVVAVGLALTVALYAPAIALGAIAGLRELG